LLALFVACKKIKFLLVMCYENKTVWGGGGTALTVYVTQYSIIYVNSLYICVCT
jgi:hypothetical protein